MTKALLGHLVLSVLPQEPALPLETRTPVESATVEFVAAQARAMPAYVRAPFSIALIAFEWLAVARYGRRYTRLGRARQRAFTSAWARSPVRAMRDVVKLVRSCALFAYLDHPIVRARLGGGAPEASRGCEVIGATGARSLGRPVPAARAADGRDAGRLDAEVVVIGSGAGGAITAATLAEAGRSVLILEEGPEIDTRAMATHTPAAVRLLYRNGGLCPILGNPTMAFAEGRCVGGSTEINTALWHRTPPEAVDRWRRLHAVRGVSVEELDGLFAEIETELCVSTLGASPPASSAVFRRGVESQGWSAVEVPRAQATDLGRSQFAPGAKRSMSRTYIPRALAAGARLFAGCRAVRLRHRGRHVTEVEAVETTPEGRRRLAIRAGTVFACGGAIQTPALLRASGIKRNVGDSLRLHPMLKVAAEFSEELDSHAAPVPIYQVHDLGPDVTLGGSVFTPGFLAMTLGENWAENEEAMRQWRRMALFHVACRGSNRGSVRAWPWTGEAVVRYDLSRADRVNLGLGLGRLCQALFAGGARRIYPAVRNHPVLSSPSESGAFLGTPPAAAAMGLTSVHLFSTCPMGEDETACATDSSGRLHGFDNLYLADASVIPDSPGVNPQATIMALALRSARRFVAASR